jgi:hypothetical protein
MGMAVAAIVAILTEFKPEQTPRALASFWRETRILLQKWGAQ